MRAALLAALVGLLPSAALAEGVTHQELSFDALAGWERDDHAAALSAFRKSCTALDAPLCEAAHSASNARAFFERYFTPVLLTDGAPPLFTGYFEPVIPGALTRDDTYHVPLYRMPQDTPPPTRAEIEAGALAGRDLELMWLADPVDAFFLQIQGSGRIVLPDGATTRVGFAGKNGQPYYAIGRALIDAGIFTPDTITADALRDWLKANPEDARPLMLRNPSYVFFREITDLPADLGPIGAMGVPVTPGRSLAVDPDVTPLGLPVWLEMDDPEPLARLMIAQDTGSAIKGAQRADLFFGTGDAAGSRAGALRHPGRMVVLVPRDAP